MWQKKKIVTLKHGMLFFYVKASSSETVEEMMPLETETLRSDFIPFRKQQQSNWQNTTTKRLAEYPSTSSTMERMRNESLNWIKEIDTKNTENLS